MAPGVSSEGSVSLTTMLPAGSGPRLVTTIVNVSTEAFTPTAGEWDLVTARSAVGGRTPVTIVAVLLTRFGSDVVDRTVAVLVTAPGVVGVIVIVAVADAPGANVPTGHS